MKIYSMTATFGKLEHETLTLEPGLNVFTGENEWGKSTWCAFLAAMFYGLDTRAKSTRTALADKEHYAPWSGSPMSGRIDLNWKGRDITVERKTAGRTPMGVFRAYETATGLDIPEITAQNCGEVILGVERSVFVRTGFIRFRDMTVTEDEALRRRLNSLVTTGGENAEADRLAEELKALKNRIRHNRTGLLPQLEEQQRRVEEQYRELSELEFRQDALARKLNANKSRRRDLENHLDNLDYAAGLESARKVSQAEIALEKAGNFYSLWDERCSMLPDRETCRSHLQKLNSLQDQLLRLQREAQDLPGEQSVPELPEALQQLDLPEARGKAREDAAKFKKLQKYGRIPAILGIMMLIAALPLAYFHRLYGLICAAAGIAMLMFGLIRKRIAKGKQGELAGIYGTRDCKQWQRIAEDLVSRRESCLEENAAIRARRTAMEESLQRLRREAAELGKLSRQDWEDALAAWNTREDALAVFRRAENHCRDLKTMVRPTKKPEFPDRLEYTREQTLRMLEECAGERTRLEHLNGQCCGAMEAIGSKETLEEQRTRLCEKIRKLEKTYGALAIAQDTLLEARQELQRRFAPGITRRAEKLMHTMTGGRYERLRIGEDLSLWAGTVEEDTMFDPRWRSDGTADQLYLALRLAVAEVMLPEAPLILDDALIRFDDTRAAAALKILKDAASNRQVILFTCHGREKAML